MISMKSFLSKFILLCIMFNNSYINNNSDYNLLLEKAKLYEQNVVYTTSDFYRFDSLHSTYYGEYEYDSEDDIKYDQSPMGSLSQIHNNEEVAKYYNTLTRVDFDYYYNEDEETLIQFAHIVGSNVNSYVIATYREEGLCDVVETSVLH